MPMAVYVQAALRDVGITMEIDLGSVAGRLTRLADFEAGVVWAISSLRNQPFRLGWYLGPDSPIGYDNPTVDSLIVQARERTHSLDGLDSIYRALMPILQEDFPITFLHRRMLAVVAHRRVQGLSAPWRNPFRSIDQLWLEDEP